MIRKLLIFALLATPIWAQTVLNPSAPSNLAVSGGGTPPPVVTPAFGTYSAAQPVTCSCTSGTSCFYNPSSEPATIASTLYAPFTVTSTATYAFMCATATVQQQVDLSASGWKICTAAGTGTGYNNGTPNSTCGGGVGTNQPSTWLNTWNPYNLSMTTTAAPGTGQTAILSVYGQTSNVCNSCTEIVSSFYEQPTQGPTYLGEVEGDIYQFNPHVYAPVTTGVEHMCGMQCNQLTGGTGHGNWEIDTNTGWQDTGVPCSPLSTTTPTHVEHACHWTNGDNSGAGQGVMHFDWIRINGTQYNINMTGNAQSTTFTAWGPQHQLGMTNPTTSGVNPSTAALAVTNENAALGIQNESAQVSGTWTITALGTATPIIEPNNYVVGNYALAQPSPVLAFGEQGTATSSPAIPISISNPSNPLYCQQFGIGCGHGTATVTGMAISGPNSGDFTLTGSCSTIAAGADCEPTILFHPTAANGTIETATLTVTLTGATTSNLTLSLTGDSATETLLSTTACPTALATSIKYQVTANLPCGLTPVFGLGSTGSNLNMNGFTATYSNASSASIANITAYSISGTTITLQTTAMTAFTASTAIAFNITSGPTWLNGQSYTVLTSPAPTTTSFAVTFSSGQTGSGSGAGSASPNVLLNAIQMTNYNAQLTLHNGSLVTGAGLNNSSSTGNLSSPIGPTGTFSLSNTAISSIFNMKFTYGFQFANAVTDNGGALVFHDNKVTPTAVGNCPNIGCRNILQAASVYMENMTTVTSGATQLYNNYQNGGPQGGIDCAAPGCIAAWNTVNPGNASGNNTNDFCFWAWGNGAQIHHNVCGNPQTAASNTRGIQLSAAQTPGINGVAIYNNLIYTIETPTNLEYGGCQHGGTYGIQGDDNPGANNSWYNNYVTSYAKGCPAQALRFTDLENLTEVSHDNTYIASHLSGSGSVTCVPNTWSDLGNGCAIPFGIDGTKGATSLRDTFYGDNGEIFIGPDGTSGTSGGVQIQSPTFYIGSNPGTFWHFLVVQAGPGTSNVVNNVHVIDPTFGPGVSPTDVWIYAQGTNTGTVSVYTADWTQTMNVTLASGPAASGAVVTWTDAFANTYSCTTNSSGVCTVKVSQYRANNDTGANQIENRNPFSLSIPKSGCTTYNATAISVSSTGTWNITLSGC